MQSTLLCRARSFAEHAPLQSTLLCRALSSAQHASLQSTLLCRARSFAEHASLQSTLLCRARSFAEHSPLQSTLLCAARFFAEHAPVQSTLLCRARSCAEHASLQSTLLCTARFFAEHASLQSTLLCRARSFAERAPLQSTLLCRAHFFALQSRPSSLFQKVSQMDSILPERLVALVRPGNDLVLRRIQSLKRCVEACGCKIMTPRYAQQFGSRLHFKRCQALPKETPFPFFLGPLFWDPFFPFFFCFLLALQRLARLKCNLEPNCCAYLGVIILQLHASTQRFRLQILRRTRSFPGRTSARSLSGRIESIWETPSKERAKGTLPLLILRNQKQNIPCQLYDSQPRCNKMLLSLSGRGRRDSDAFGPWILES